MFFWERGSPGRRATFSFSIFRRSSDKLWSCDGVVFIEDSIIRVVVLPLCRFARANNRAAAVEGRIEIRVFLDNFMRILYDKRMTISRQNLTLKWILSYKSPCQAGWWRGCRMKKNLKKTLSYTAGARTPGRVPQPDCTTGKKRNNKIANVKMFEFEPSEGCKTKH